MIIYLNLIDTSRKYVQYEEYFYVYRFNFISFISTFYNIPSKIQHKDKYKTKLIRIFIPREIDNICENASDKRLSTLIKLQRKITSYNNSFEVLINNIKNAPTPISIKYLFTLYCDFISDQHKCIRSSNVEHIWIKINQYNSLNK